MDAPVDYYKTYYTEFLERKGAREFRGNVWLEFAKWLLQRFGDGSIENPTAAGLLAWNTFYTQMVEKNHGTTLDVLLVRAHDNVTRRSLVEPVMERNEGYEAYKAGMIKRQAAAGAYKRQVASVYKGFIGEDNIITMGAEDCDFMTQREWMAAETQRNLREKWLVDNKDRFVEMAFAELDSAIVQERELRASLINTAAQRADTWTVTIPESKKEKTALAKQLKAEFRFKDAVSGLKADQLHALLVAKIAERKKVLHEEVVRMRTGAANFEKTVTIWDMYRGLELEELKTLDTDIRKNEKPVLEGRTPEGVKAYNTAMSALNQRLKIVSKLIQMRSRGIRCMDDWKNYNGGYSMYFEFN
jgi:hypothetical protein